MKKVFGVLLFLLTIICISCVCYGESSQIDVVVKYNNKELPSTPIYFRELNFIDVKVGDVLLVEGKPSNLVAGMYLGIAEVDKNGEPLEFGLYEDVPICANIFSFSVPSSYNSSSFLNSLSKG